MSQLNEKILLAKKKELLDYSGEFRIVSFEEMHEQLKAGGNIKKININLLPTFNEIFDGFEETELFVLSGPTGMGKTTFAITLHSAFWRNNIKSLFFTYEVGARNFLKKIPEGVGGFMPFQHKPKDLDWLEERIIEAQAKYGTFVVFIDHLHYVIPFSQNGNFSLVVGQTMQRLKDIARQHRIIIFLIAHVQKTKLEATINDIRDSSFVAQEADGVILLNRQFDKKTEAYTNDVKVSIFKNRRAGDLKTLTCTMIDKEFREIDSKSQELTKDDYGNDDNLTSIPSFK